MRVLILLPNDKLGGAEQYLKMVAQYHDKSDVHVVFFRNTSSCQWEDVGTHVTKKFLNNRFQFVNILKLTFYFLKGNNRYDYIFTSHVSTNAVLGLLVRLGLVKKKYFVARESTSIFKRFSGAKLLIYKLAYFFGYKRIDLLICQTDYMKKQLLEGLPKKLSKLNVQVIPNPVDLDLIKSKQEEPPDFNPPDNYIVTAGRLIVEKGYDILIEAFANSIRTTSDTKLLILGEGEERDNLKKLILKLNLNGMVLMPGRVSNVYPFFKNAQLCIVSSRIEGFPNVLLQMMSQNENIISTLCAGGIENLPKIIKVPANDSVALTKAIADQLKNKEPLNNKQAFEDYLQKRSIVFFIKKVNSFLKITSA